MEKENNILGIIPARFASTRFPGKPLNIIAGQSMIQRVYKQTSKASMLSDVVVATDDLQIFDHVNSFGGKAVMTSGKHNTGTERCAEVIQFHPYNTCSHVINIQGDEPLIDPKQIDLLAAILTRKNTSLATLIRPLTTSNDLNNPNVIKVVVDKWLKTLWFSRAPIPYVRNPETTNPVHQHQYFQHIGIYGYTSQALKNIASLPPTPNETAESLEQLRWIENGMSLYAAVSPITAPAVSMCRMISKKYSLFSKIILTMAFRRGPLNTHTNLYTP